MNIAGSSNQEIRPNIFGYDCEYPPRNSAWDRLSQEHSPPTSSTNILPNGFDDPQKTIPIRPINPYFNNNGYSLPESYLPQQQPQTQEPYMSSCFPNTSVFHSRPSTSYSKTGSDRNIMVGSNGTRISSYRCKRKLKSQLSQPSKQHITDDRMAEHLSKLHISSETPSSDFEPEQNRVKRLYVCEEMRKLQSDTILPKSLLNRIQRPCTALVLWSPPRPLVDENDISSNNNNDNNNHEQLPDNNVMDLDVR